MSAIASQSLRTATSIEHGQHAIEGRLVALGRAHDLLLQARWANADFANTNHGEIDPLSREDFETFKQIGVLPVKMEATNQSEKRWFCWDWRRKPSDFLH